METETANGAWRHEGNMVVLNGGALTNRCIKCNASGGGKPIKFEFTWNPHGLKYGGKVRSAVAVATNRRGKVYGFYCADHRPKRGRAAAIFLSLLGLSAVIVFVSIQIAERQRMAGQDSSPLPMMFGVFLGCGVVGAAAFYFGSPPRGIVCQRIEGKTLWLTAPSSAFLESLPMLGSDQAAMAAE